MATEKMLITMDQVKPLEIFVDGKYDALLKFIKDASEIEKPDASTSKGRALIRTMAAQVASSKVFVVGKGKDLADSERQKIAETLEKMNTSRKFIEDALVYRKAEVREPLTLWEAEEKKKEEAQKLLNKIEADHTEGIDLNIFFDEKKKLKADQAKLDKERLRREAEEAATKKIETDQKEAREAETTKRLNAEVEVERLKKKTLDDAATARQQSLKNIGVHLEWADLRSMETAVWSELFEAKNKAFQAAENQKLIDDERERVRLEEVERQRVYDEKAANQTHRKRINNQSLKVIDKILATPHAEMTPGQQIVLAISKGEVPNISIKY